MFRKVKDMTKGEPWKLMSLFALPLLLSNICQQLYNVVDSLVVGNYLGKEALASVSSSSYFIFLFVSFFVGTSSGAGVIIAKYFGAKEYDSVSRAIHTNIAFGLVSSAILTVFGILFSPTLLRLINTPESVLPNSISYFRWYFAGIIGNIMYNTLNGILQALGNSTRPLIYLFISSLLNVFLDLLFVGHFKMGVASAAIATSISQITSALLCFLYLSRKGTFYQVEIKKIKFHKDMFSQIVKYGIPSGVQNSVIALANIFVQSNINTFGDAAMAGCGSYNKLEGFAFIPVNSFTLSISTFIGQNLGAKQYDRAKKGARFGILCAVIMTELIGIILYLLAPQLIGLFSSDPEVIYYGVLDLRTISLFYFLLAFSHSIAAVCRGAGKAVVPMIIMLVVWCVLRVTYINIAMLYAHEIQLIFYAYPLTWAISGVFYLFYYLFSDWVHGFEKEGL